MLVRYSRPVVQAQNTQWRILRRCSQTLLFCLEIVWPVLAQNRNENFAELFVHFVASALEAINIKFVFLKYLISFLPPNHEKAAKLTIAPCMTS